MTRLFFFSKNSNSDLHLNLRTLKVELTWDIVIPNICVELYETPSINVGAWAMTKFFSINCHSYLDFKNVREKSRECHNHKPQPFPDPKRKRKPTNPNKHKSNKRTKRTKSTKISSLFPKRGNRNTKRTEKHKNKMTHGKTYNKSPRGINHKATKRKTNTGTTALERSVE